MLCFIYMLCVRLVEKAELDNYYNKSYIDSLQTGSGTTIYKDNIWGNFRKIYLKPIPNYPECYVDEPPDDCIIEYPECSSDLHNVMYLIFDNDIPDNIYLEFDTYKCNIDKFKNNECDFDYIYASNGYKCIYNGEYADPGDPYVNCRFTYNYHVYNHFEWIRYKLYVNITNSVLYWKMCSVNFPEGYENYSRCIDIYDDKDSDINYKYVEMEYFKNKLKVKFTCSGCGVNIFEDVYLNRSISLNNSINISSVKLIGGGVNEIYTKYEIDNKLDNINLVVDDKLDEYVKNELVNDIISEKINPLSNKYDELEKEQKEIDNKFNNYYNKNYTANLEERISSLEDNITALNKYVEEMELSNKLKDAVSGIDDWYKDDGTSIVLNSEEGGVCKYTSAATLRPQDMTNDYECFSLITFTPGPGTEYESGYAGYYINTRTNKQIPVSGNMYNSQKYDYSINIENDKLMLLRLGKCNIGHIGHGFVYYIKNIT